MKNKIIKHERKRDASEEELLMEYDEFFKRIQKSLYFGIETTDFVSPQMAEYASQMFNKLQQGHSLNRLNVETAGNTIVQCSYLIIAFIYLDRLRESDPEYARKITPTELFLISMIISTKFNVDYDSYIYIDLWSENFNISIDAIKKLEIDFLNALDWKAFVSNEEYFEKLEEIELILARNEFQKRGWMTYTELIKLSPTIEWRGLIKEFLSYNISIAFSYALGFLTIAGAFIVASHVPGHLLSKTTTTTTTSLMDPCNTTMNVHSSQSNNVPIDNDNQVDLTTGDILSNGYDELIKNTIDILNRRMIEETDPDETPRNENESCPYNVVKNYDNFKIVSPPVVPPAYNTRLIQNHSTLYNYKSQKWSENHGNVWNFWLNKKFI